MSFGLDVWKELRDTDVVKNMRSVQRAAGGGIAPRAASGTEHVQAPVDDTGPNRNERDTRAQVARLIMEHGPCTAATLGERLGITPAAIRRHLDSLLGEGMIEAREGRSYGQRRRGRPARFFAITDEGRNAFYHAYDDMAASALRFIEEQLGPAAVSEFARHQVADLERRYGPAMRSASLEQRLRVLAEALSGDGYAASVNRLPSSGVPKGEQLCQHHCPVAHVAADYPQLCEAETEVFARLLGTPVQRLATIAHGDGICTTHVSPRDLNEREQAETARTHEREKATKNKSRRTST